MECELTGPCCDTSEFTLFLSVQHPGEDNATHRSGDEEVQAYALPDRNGGPFEQLRRVPLGSNWPSSAAGTPPPPGVVAIRRLDGGPLPGSQNARALEEHPSTEITARNRSISGRFVALGGLMPPLVLSDAEFQQLQSIARSRS